jgi:hypothetical protein
MKRHEGSKSRGVLVGMWVGGESRAEFGRYEGYLLDFGLGLSCGLVICETGELKVAALRW